MRKLEQIRMYSFIYWWFKKNTHKNISDLKNRRRLIWTQSACMDALIFPLRLSLLWGRLRKTERKLTKGLYYRNSYIWNPLRVEKIKCCNCFLCRKVSAIKIYADNDSGCFCKITEVKKGKEAPIHKLPLQRRVPPVLLSLWPTEEEDFNISSTVQETHLPLSPSSQIPSNSWSSSVTRTCYIQKQKKNYRLHKSLLQLLSLWRDGC